MEIICLATFILACYIDVTVKIEKLPSLK